MNIKRYGLINAADGWLCKVVRVDRMESEELIRTWLLDSQLFGTHG